MDVCARLTGVHLWEVKSEDFNREEKMLGPQIQASTYGGCTLAGGVH